MKAVPAFEVANPGLEVVDVPGLGEVAFDRALLDPPAPGVEAVEESGPGRHGFETGDDSLWAPRGLSGPLPVDCSREEDYS